MARLQRSIGDCLSDVAAAAAEAERLCALDGADIGQALRIGLAVDELAANALLHGVTPGEPPKIEVEVSTDERMLRLQVRAWGPHFDPLTRTGFSCDDQEGNGRGLHLVAAFADELTYRREGGANVTTFCVQKYEQADL